MSVREAVAVEIPRGDLNKRAKKILGMADDYIKAMQTNRGRLPSAVYINQKQAQTIQDALDALADSQSNGPAKVEPLKLEELVYRGLPFRVS